ncbi:hypothetical protein CKAH01_03509 [Colletotrichum kahawae]|uniref:Uncharacterized protein n=1 Tax=Colletotrichum kahawae TaxID=34407 RepID=A0AAD9YRL8_COLKA|nr:hypothetical protein CKAH01_03509 [Colletotrichum kahawae]
MRRRQTRISRVDIISHESHVAESIHLCRQKLKSNPGISVSQSPCTVQTRMLGRGHTLSSYSVSRE